MASSRRAQLVFVTALIIGGSLGLSLIWTTLLCSRSKRVVFESCDAGFCLRVAEGMLERRLLGSNEQLYEVWLTRRGSPDYGYVVHHSFGWHGFDQEATIRASKVEWASAGVTLTEPSGQTLFVPFNLYAGGR